LLINYTRHIAYRLWKGIPAFRAIFEARRSVIAIMLIHVTGGYVVANCLVPVEIATRFL
jgi:hypothetical protein